MEEIIKVSVSEDVILDGIEIKKDEPIVLIHQYEYYANPRLSQSKLKDLKQSPKHFWAKHIDSNKEPQKDTEAMTFGRAVHMYVFEHGKFFEDYIITQKFDKRTKEGKAQHAEFVEKNKGKRLISQEEKDMIFEIGSSIYKKNTSKILFGNNALIEHELYWTDEEFNIDCKAKLDFFIEPCDKFPNGLILDLKTTINASSEEFGRSIHKYGYDHQVAFYCKAVKQIYKTGGYPPFYFIAAEKTLPYECAFYEASEEVLMVGLKKNQALMQKYKECLRLGEWNGYPDEIQTIGMPAWAVRDYQDNMFDDLPF